MKKLSLIIIFVLILSIFIPILNVKANVYYAYFDDEGATFWSNASWGSGTNKLNIATDLNTVYSGLSSVKLQLNTSGGTQDVLAISHTFAALDFSQYNAVGFWIYGSISNQWLNFYCQVDGANYYYWILKENWVGWKQIVFDFSSATIIGSPSWSSVVKVIIANAGLVTPAPNRIMYIDLNQIILFEETSFVGVIPEFIINLGILGFLIILICCVILTITIKYLGIIGFFIMILIGLNYFEYYQNGNTDLFWLSIFSWLSAMFILFLTILRSKK